MSKIIRKDQLPPVCINLLTKDRTDYAVTTVKNALDKLHYDGRLVWYITDGSSDESHINKLVEIIPEDIRWGSIRGCKVSVGECWNLGLSHILDDYDIYLRLEDDMVIKSPMDITTWVKMLMTQKPVGMVRLGQIVINLDLVSVKFKTYTHIGYSEEVYLSVMKTQPYAWSGHPALIHKRFHDVYGYFPTDMSPGETEVMFDQQVRSIEGGPTIVFPYDMGKYGTWGNWDHIGKEKST